MLTSHLAISQQVALLQQRGLVSDASILASRLNDVEYYRFCAYQPAFRISLQNELLITMLLGNHGLHMRSNPISCYLFIQVVRPPNGIPSRSSFCKNRSNKAFSCIKESCQIIGSSILYGDNFSDYPTLAI